MGNGVRRRRLPRHRTLFDLLVVSIGVGETSGVFVLLAMMMLRPSDALICPRISRQRRLWGGLLSATPEASGSGATEGSLADVRRVFAISDLHTDAAANMEWLTERCNGIGSASSSDDDDDDDPNFTRLATPGPNDALIVAGDISHDLRTLERTLSTLVAGLQGCQIFFVPGNHEAWVGGKAMDAMGLDSSLDKLDLVTEICDKLGVYTTHELVGTSHRRPVWIVPILSWYDGSLALPGCDDLCHDFGRWPWVDFTRCEWGAEFDGRQRSGGATDGDGSTVEDSDKIPGYDRIPAGLTESMLRRNVGAVEEIRERFEEHVRVSSVPSHFREVEDSSSSPAPSSAPGLISFSHFLPNARTLPDWKDPESDAFYRREWLDHPVPDVSAKFAYVAGSELIDRQVRSIVPPSLRSPSTTPSSSTGAAGGVRHVHVFGHSHRPKDFRHDSVRYVHNPIGKQVEREMNMIDPNADFQLLWDATSDEGEVEGETVIRYWEEKGGGVEVLAANMARRKRSRRKMARSKKSDVHKTPQTPKK